MHTQDVAPSTADGDAAVDRRFTAGATSSSASAICCAAPAARRAPSSCSAARRASASPPCSHRPRRAPPTCRSSPATAPRPRPGCPTPRCISCCGPCSTTPRRSPPSQARALRCALGLEFGSRPEPFLVSLAVLSVLAEAAERRPLLCVVDDAQWLDEATADALLFVARRLEAEPIAMLLAAREEPDERLDAPEVAQLDVGGLDAQAAARDRRSRQRRRRSRPMSPSGSSARRTATRSRCSSSRRR